MKDKSKHLRMESPDLPDVEALLDKPFKIRRGSPENQRFDTKSIIRLREQLYRCQDKTQIGN